MSPGRTDTVLARPSWRFLCSLPDGCSIHTSLPTVWWYWRCVPEHVHLQVIWLPEIRQTNKCNPDKRELRLSELDRFLFVPRGISSDSPVVIV